MITRDSLGLWRHAAVAILLLFLAYSPATGADVGWRLRVDGYWVDPDGESSEIDADGVRVITDARSSFGLGITAEFRFSRRLGTEFGFLGAAEVDFEVRQSAPGGQVFTLMDTTTFVPYFAGLNIHLTPGKKVDLYLGGLLAYITYSDLRISSPPGEVRVGVDTDIAPGVVLGLDVPVKERGWFFNASIRYMNAEFSGTVVGDRERVDFDPLIVGVGFGYRFKHR